MIATTVLGSGVSLAVQGESSHRISGLRLARNQHDVLDPCSMGTTTRPQAGLVRALQEELAWELAAPLVLLTDDANPGGTTDAAEAAETGIPAALAVAHVEVPPKSFL